MNDQPPDALTPMQRMQWSAVERSFARQRQSIQERLRRGEGDLSSLQRQLRTLDEAEQDLKRGLLTPEQRRTVLVPDDRAPLSDVRALPLLDASRQHVDLTAWRTRTVVLAPWEIGVASLPTLRALDRLALRHPQVVFVALNIRNTEPAIASWTARYGGFPNLRFVRTLGSFALAHLPGAVIVPPGQRSEVRLAAGPALLAELASRLPQKTK